MLAGELIGGMNSQITSGTEGSFIGTADHISEGGLADITVNSHCVTVCLRNTALDMDMDMAMAMAS